MMERAPGLRVAAVVVRAAEAAEAVEAVASDEDPAEEERRYNLTFSVNARNILNKVNVATPIGVLSSPNFGQSIALAGGPFSSAAANRKIELQAMFSF